MKWGLLGILMAFTVGVPMVLADSEPMAIDPFLLRLQELFFLTRRLRETLGVVRGPGRELPMAFKEMLKLEHAELSEILGQTAAITGVLTTSTRSPSASTTTMATVASSTVTEILQRFTTIPSTVSTAVLKIKTETEARPTVRTTTQTSRPSSTTTTRVEAPSTTRAATTTMSKTTSPVPTVPTTSFTRLTTAKISKASTTAAPTTTTTGALKKLAETTVAPPTVKPSPFTRACAPDAKSPTTWGNGNRKRGICVSSDDLGEVCAEAFSMFEAASAKKDCSGFDGEWCCYEPINVIGTA